MATHQNRKNQRRKDEDLNAHNIRGGTDQERHAHGKMTREESGRLGGRASHSGGNKERSRGR
jgi:hypothetical protein